MVNDCEIIVSAQQGAGEDDRVEGDVVLTQEVVQLHLQDRCKTGKGKKYIPVHMYSSTYRACVKQVKVINTHMYR